MIRDGISHARGDGLEPTLLRCIPGNGGPWGPSRGVMFEGSNPIIGWVRVPSRCGPVVRGFKTPTMGFLLQVERNVPLEQSRQPQIRIRHTSQPLNSITNQKLSSNPDLEARKTPPDNRLLGQGRWACMSLRYNFERLCTAGG